jgi:hypothetical protein
MQALGSSLELHVAAMLCALVVAAGCKPQIGDDCQVSTDCSNVGDRLCDTTQPGGYCTIFNCEPGTCPEEAICVAFKTSIAAACTDPQDGIRLQRTFCLRNCSDNSDCRGGYDCIDLGNPQNPWGAKIMENGSYNGAVCIVPHKGITQAGGDGGLQDPPGICTGTDAAFDVQFWEPDTGSTPLLDAGADGAADAGADSGDASADAADAGADASLDAASD